MGEESERDFKTTCEHWEVVLRYSSLLKSKFEGCDGDRSRLKQQWEEMVNTLNSLGYGQRSIQKWKDAIGRWKSKVKAKARRHRQEMAKTGGGPIRVAALTEIEERLMNVIGWKYATGDSNVELGLPSTTDSTSTSEGVQINILNPQEDSIMVKPFPAATERQGSPIIPESSQAAAQPPPLTPSLKRKRPSPQPKRRKVISSSNKSQRYVTLSNMHNEQVQLLHQINTNMKNMCDAFKNIANDVNRFVNFFLNDE